MNIPYLLKLLARRVYLRAYYYKTRHWKTTARLKRESVHGRCEICRLPKRLDVHHKTEGYKNLWHEKLADLMAVCRECHNGLHK